MTNLILFGSFFILLMLKVPIGVSVGMSVALYLGLCSPQPMTYLASNMFTAVDSFPLMAIPFFVLAGALMEGGGLSKRLANLGAAAVGHVTGGFAIVTVITCMFFGAISGSGPATVAAIGAVMVPAMVEHGYDKSFSVALIAASGCLGVIVPPSIPMVLYGVSTGASVGTLFMGGFGPALVLGGGLCVLSVIIAKKRGYKGTGENFSFARLLKEFRSAMRKDHQYRIHAQLLRRSPCSGLCGLQRRYRADHKGPVQRLGCPGRPGQCPGARIPGYGQHGCHPGRPCAQSGDPEPDPCQTVGKSGGSGGSAAVFGITRVGLSLWCGAAGRWRFHGKISTRLTKQRVPRFRQPFCLARGDVR